MQVPGQSFRLTALDAPALTAHGPAGEDGSLQQPSDGLQWRHPPLCLLWRPHRVRQHDGPLPSSSYAVHVAEPDLTLTYLAASVSFLLQGDVEREEQHPSRDAP